jgi:HEAT repeat protein
LAAVRALGRIGPAANGAVPHLIKAMRTERHPDLREQRRRVSAAGTLGSTGADWSQALPALVKTLGAMGPAASPAVPDLVELPGSDWNLAFLATRALESIGPEAQTAVPALVERLNDKRTSVAAQAGATLVRIDPSKRHLVEARLHSIPVMNDLYARAILSGALGRRTPEADGFARRFLLVIDSHLHNLVAPTAEDLPNAREEVLDNIEDVIERLSSLGTGAEGSIGRLTELTHHSDPEVRRLASEALSRIRPR